MKTLRTLFFLMVITLITACAESADLETEADNDTPSALPFTETFDDAETCFNLASGDASDLSIENGELVLELTEGFRIERSTCEDVPLGDFSLNMDVYDDSSTDEFRFFGVQLRRGPLAGGATHAYIVRVGLGGGSGPVACIGLATDNSWEDDLTQSPSGDSCWVELAQPIQAGEWNQFEVTADGPDISLTLNGDLALRVSDSRLNRGVFALLGGTHEAEAARFIFDNIRITAPDG